MLDLIQLVQRIVFEWPWRNSFFFFFYSSELLKCPEFECLSDVRDIVTPPDLAADIQFGKCHRSRCEVEVSFTIFCSARPVVAPPPARRSGLAGLLGGLAGLLLCLLCLATLGLLGLFATFIAVTAYLGKISPLFDREQLSWSLLSSL